MSARQGKGINTVTKATSRTSDVFAKRGGVLSPNLVPFDMVKFDWRRSLPENINYLSNGIIYKAPQNTKQEIPMVFRQNIVLVSERLRIKLRKMGCYQGYISEAEAWRKYSILGNDYQQEARLGELRFSVYLDNKWHALENWAEEITTICTGIANYTYKYKSKDLLNIKVITPAQFHGVIVEARSLIRKRGLKIQWQYVADPDNRFQSIDLDENYAKISYAGLGNAIGYMGASSFELNTVKQASCLEGELELNRAPEYVWVIWGAKSYDQNAINEILKQVEACDIGDVIKNKIKGDWRENYIDRFLNPEEWRDALILDCKKAAALDAQLWKINNSRFELITPDKSLNCHVNKSVSDVAYYYNPPGLIAGIRAWQMYFGKWLYGLIDAGRLDEMRENLSLVGAFHDNVSAGISKSWGACYGAIRWVTMFLTAFNAEDDGNYWIDMLYRYYCWTNDEDLLKQLWPVIKKVIRHQCEFNDPDGDGFGNARYEWWNCDAHQKGPKVPSTTTMLANSHEIGAMFARIMGERGLANAYREKARDLRRKCQQELWDKDNGFFAHKDARGVRQVMPEAMDQFLPVIFGAANEFQAYQAARYIRDNLFVNIGERRTYEFMNNWWPIVWSHHYVHIGDSLVSVMSAIQGGDEKHYFPVFKTACEIGEGADVYLIVKALFGVTPELQNGIFRVAPTIAPLWNKARLRTPSFSISYTRKRDQHMWCIIPPGKTRKLIVELPARGEIKSVKHNGRKVKYKIAPHISKARIVIEVEVKSQKRNMFIIESMPLSFKGWKKLQVLKGQSVVLKDKNIQIVKVINPQECIKVESINNGSLTFVAAESGSKTFFVEVMKGNCRWYEPVELDSFEKPLRYMREAEGMDPETNLAAKIRNPEYDSKTGRLRLKLETVVVARTRSGEINCGGAKFKVEITPIGKTALLIDSIIPRQIRAGFLPGKNRMTLEYCDAKLPFYLVCWGAKTAENKYAVVDIKKDYNFAVEELFNSKSNGLNTGYYYDVFSNCRAWEKKNGQEHCLLDRLQYHEAVPTPKLEGWKASLKITPAGIPFKLGENVKRNVAAIAHWDRFIECVNGGNRLWRRENLPQSLLVKINRKVSKIYLLGAYYFYPTKSYLPIARIHMIYTTGETGSVDLAPPYDMGSYMQAHGVECYAVKLGIVRSGVVGDFNTVFYPNGKAPFTADVLDCDCDETRELKEVKIECLETETILGILGITALNK